MSKENNIKFEIEEEEDPAELRSRVLRLREEMAENRRQTELMLAHLRNEQQRLQQEIQAAVHSGAIHTLEHVPENEAEADNPFDINWSERSSLTDNPDSNRTSISNRTSMNSLTEEGKGRRRRVHFYGGALPVKDIKELLKHSYDKQPSSHGDYELDPELSGQRVQVYKKKGSNQAVVVHRGTQGIHDWGNDLKYALGFDISNSNRLKHARDIQQKAEAKYGANNISTLGHSLGSKIARDVGQNSNEIINLNPAIAPQDVNKPKSDKEYDIRTSLDPVSALSNLTQNTNTITIPSQTFNPLTEHSTDTLDRLPQDQQIGRGHIKKMPMKHLKDLVKRMSGRKFPVTKKRKHELVEHVCHCCNIK